MANIVLANKIAGLASKIGTAIYPKLPTICVVGGSVAVAGGAFLACKATLRVNDILEDHNSMIGAIDNAVEAEDNDYSEKEMRKDKFTIYRATAFKVVKNYAPAIGIGVLGFASIFYGYGLITKWHALAVSSVAALDESFARYRNNVIAEYGEDVDRRLAGDDTVGTKIDIVTSVDEDGVTKETEEVTAITLEEALADDFTRIFDYTNPEWDNNDNMHVSRFISTGDMYTHYLQKGQINHLFFNKPLKSLGFDETGHGHFYGWTRRPGCEVRIDYRRFFWVFNKDDDKQMPMMVLIDNDDEDAIERFKQAMADDVVKREALNGDPTYSSVGYLLTFNVDCDESGVPRQIYTNVFGENKHKNNSLKYIG